MLVYAALLTNTSTDPNRWCTASTSEVTLSGSARSPATAHARTPSAVACSAASVAPAPELR